MVFMHLKDVHNCNLTNGDWQKNIWIVNSFSEWNVVTKTETVGRILLEDAIWFVDITMFIKILLEIIIKL